MRIAYLIAWRGGRRTGPFKKMAAQADCWTALGHEVALFVTTGAEALADWRGLPQASLVVSGGRGGLASVAARTRSAAAVRSWQPDVIYLRHGVTTPGLSALVRRFPTVIEVNGDDVLVAASSSAAKGLWARMSRGRVLRRVDGAVFMTRELALRRRFARYRIPTEVIPNGIALDAFPELSACPDLPIRLVMVGHPDTPWHGADKLVGLALRQPDWQIDVIGPNADDLRAEPPANLHLHGELELDDYLAVLGQADAAFGTLAMHRVGGNENPALKTRECLALGIPVITGCPDPDFPDHVDFLLVLPNTERNIADGDSEIVEFVRRWKGRRVERTQIANLDLSIKEPRRISAMAEAIQRRRLGRPDRSTHRGR